jgi:hypothetical protein
MPLPATPFLFQRCTVHWCPPQRLDLVEHVREGRLQLVQAGNFGPMFYGLADDPTVERWFVGQPLQGIAANLDYARDLIAGVQAHGARYVGTMSMSWHYGDHDAQKGLWEAWPRLWTADLLGEPPCDDPAEAMQRRDGGLRHWPIEGRPYRTYSGCYANPTWRAILRAMIRQAVDLGVDGFNVHHGFENLCDCEHCRAWLWPRLQRQFSDEELTAAFGTAGADAADSLLTVREACPAPLRQAVAQELERASAHLRKECFDDLFVDYARSLKPDLLLAQWYHKYDFKPRDERSLLPPDLWARDESYIWYSQGGQKGVTWFDHGWLADMGLPARFLHAACGGRPFVINKYDWQRWRLSIAEMAAHGGAGLAVHWAPHGEDDRAAGAEERYASRVFRYHRFLADHEELFAGARTYSEVALVYPRRGEVAGDPGCTDALRRIGTILENHHFLFDIVLDEQITERADRYDALVLAGVTRLSPAEVAFLRLWLERDGRVLAAGDIGTLREDGRPRSESPLHEDKAAGLEHLPALDWAPDRVEVEPGLTLPCYPPPERDPLGEEVLSRLDSLLEGRWLQTDAPWFVHVRAWRTAGGERLCLHWVNYRQVENLDDEVPLEQGPFTATVRLPGGSRAQRIEWLDPEEDKAEELAFQREAGSVEFRVERLVVYGIAVVHLKEGA